MGFRLRRALADALPADLGPMERLVALELADRCHDKTGEGYGADLLETVARRCGLANSKQVGRVLRALAGHGLEFRVSQGVDSNGRDVFAYRGRQTRYRVPLVEPVPGVDPVDNLRKVPGGQDHPEVNGPAEPGPLPEKGPGSGPERSRLPYLMVPGGRDPTAVPQEPQLASSPPGNGKGTDAVDRVLEAVGFPAADRSVLEQYLAEHQKGAGVIVHAARDGTLPTMLESYRRWATPVLVPANGAQPARDSACPVCVAGWVGEDDDGRPIPCPACKPHAARTR